MAPESLWCDCHIMTPVTPVRRHHDDHDDDDHTASRYGMISAHAGWPKAQATEAYPPTGMAVTYSVVGLSQPGSALLVLHLEIKYKKPHFQYNLYQDCGFLHLISQCSSLRRAREA
eukprot:3508352-Rhodomonas_salina.1